MKLPARHITGFFLVLVWFTPLLFILVVNIEEKLVHHRMMEKMEREHLREIVVPAASVTWMEDDEISLGGHMFDVESFSLNNGIYTFKGLFDEDETRLMLQLKENTGKNKEGNKLLAQFLEWVYLPACIKEKRYNLSAPDCSIFALLQAASFKRLPKTVIAPPPDACVVLQTS